MNELPEVRCSECDRWFTVIYNYNPLGPEYCPFCGEEIDYDKLESR